MAQKLLAELHERRFTDQRFYQAIFFVIPTRCLRAKDSKDRSKSVEDAFHDFLIHQFEGFTASQVSNFDIHYRGSVYRMGACTQYEVPAQTKSFTQALKARVAEIAKAGDMTCVYFKVAGEMHLIFPK